MPEIATNQLSLTPLVASDAQPFFEYRSDPVVCRYQSFAPCRIEDARMFIKQSQTSVFGQPGSWFQFGIRLRESGRLVGDLGIHFLTDHEQQVEIGFTVAAKDQGHGFGTEAVTGLLGYLFGPLQQHRVMASVDPRNKSSIALLQRVGLRQEAHFRESLWLKGEWVDDLVFAILKSEWINR